MGKYIEDLIKQGEHQQQDFKFEVSDARKIARSLVAFANTDGGTLLVGVKDNGNISGVRSDEEIYMVDAAAKMYCRPVIDYSVRTWKVDGKTVLEVTIPKSKQHHHLALVETDNWLPFVRVHDENIQATPIHVKVWEKANTDIGTYFAYTTDEKRILDLLESEVLVSFAQICKIAMISRQKAEDLLSDMIHFGIVGMQYADKRFKFEKTKG